MKRHDRLALWFSLGLVLGLALGVMVPTKARACDEQFIQEPTWKDPVSVQLDWGIGFAFVTYSFIDGRKLVAMYQLQRIDTSEPTAMDDHPLFYVVIEPDGKQLTYIDPEEHGECADISRYESISDSLPRPY